jgi:hypothetical protein
VFSLVLLFGVGAFIAGEVYDMSLPPDVSERGHLIDHLYMFILYLTGAVFIARR